MVSKRGTAPPTYLAGGVVPAGQVAVDVVLPHPIRLAHTHRRHVARLDQPVHGHGRDAHQLRHFGHGQKPGLRIGLHPCLPTPCLLALYASVAPVASFERTPLHDWIRCARTGAYRSCDRTWRGFWVSPGRAPGSAPSLPTRPR